MISTENRSEKKRIKQKLDKVYKISKNLKQL